jgi:hypothetical protein
VFGVLPASAGEPFEAQRHYVVKHYALTGQKRIDDIFWAQVKIELGRVPSQPSLDLHVVIDSNGRGKLMLKKCGHIIWKLARVGAWLGNLVALSLAIGILIEATIFVVISVVAHLFYFLLLGGAILGTPNQVARRRFAEAP